MNQFAKPGLAEEKLPPVSTADNGKVLGVNNGVWDKVAASGGSDLPEVTSSDKDKYLHTNSSTGDLEWSAVSGGGGGVLTITADENGICDASYNDVIAAAEAGKLIILITTPPLPGWSNIYDYFYHAVYDEDENYIVNFINETVTAETATAPLTLGSPI